MGPWVAGMGGLALLAVFFIPVLSPAQRSGIVPAAVFLDGEMWARFRPVMIWLVGLIAFGVLGALCPVSARVGDPLQAWVERGISLLARLLDDPVASVPDHEPAAGLV